MKDLLCCIVKEFVWCKRCGAKKCAQHMRDPRGCPKNFSGPHVYFKKENYFRKGNKMS